MQIRTHGGPESTHESYRTIRYHAGHPEGFPEAFANIYADAAEVIAARIAGCDANPDAISFPTAEDGVEGMKFVEACIASAEHDGRWTIV